MKKNGFTLVELLAVIAVLAILVAIVMPNVMKEYNKAKADVFVVDAQSFVNSAMSKFTNDALIQSGKTMYYSNIYNSDLNTRTLDIDSDKNYFIEMDRNGNIKRFVLYDNTYCYDIFTTYGGDSIGNLEGTKSVNNNGNPISKTTLNSSAVWESGNDSVDITVTKKDGVIESYFVKGCEANRHSFDKDIEADTNVMSLYGVLQKEAEEGTYAKKYEGLHKDSYTKNATHDIYHFRADNDTEADVILNKNNVLFANYCWQMTRTTDTGGVRLLYNGKPVDGKCSLGRSDNGVIGGSIYNSSGLSVADVGYVYGTRYTARFITSYNGYYLGESVNYVNGKYELVNPIQIANKPEHEELLGHHYFCVDNDIENCEEVRYIYYYATRNHLRTILLEKGDTSVFDTLDKMLKQNLTDSSVKTKVDTWYENNLLSYSGYFEDSIYCNSRSLYEDPGFFTFENSGWNPEGYAAYDLHFGLNGAELGCNNETDKFSTSNPNAKLKYPIGLPTTTDLKILNNNKLRSSGDEYWTSTASQFYNEHFTISKAKVYSVTSEGSIGSSFVSNSIGIRPMISLRAGVKFKNGDGSTSNPYVVK